jgi:uncharacterized protein
MLLLDGRLVLAARDLNDFLACRHLTSLNLAAATEGLRPPDERDPLIDVLSRRGTEHEQAYLRHLRDRKGRRVVEIAPPRAGLAALEASAEATLAAMRNGADAIYQAALFDTQWTGYADFLLKVPRSSALGAWSYEVADAKLARQAKPHFLLQLCTYSEQVARLQGIEPEHMHVVLGGQAPATFRYRDFGAYHRRLKQRLVAFVADRPATYPDPVEHCAVCRWAPRCDAQRLADDHLTLVANLRRDQAARLVAAGVGTLADFARFELDGQKPPLPEATFHALQLQARLQLHHRQTGHHRYKLLPPEPGRGFFLLPPPAPGDVFLDLEGDPFLGDGLEYLFGLGWEERGEWQYRPFWAHSAAEERRALEEVIDFLTERLGRHPKMHVYHYGHYEPTALKRLAGRYGTREDALDDLLRQHVLVDLFTVVRQAVRVSQPGYSLKKLEALYLDRPREGGITDGNTSTVAYERWLNLQDEALLNEIARYNADDVRSTRSLRDWLLRLRDEARRKFRTVIEWTPPEPRERDGDAEGRAAEDAALVARLLAGVPRDGDDATPEQRARTLMAHLLEYHHREERPVWWAFFDRCQTEPEALVDDPEVIGNLTPDGQPKRVKRSQLWTFRFPPQETKLVEGEVYDPETQQKTGTLVEVNATEGWLKLKRGPKLAGAPLPRALVPGGPYRTPEQRRALRRLAGAIADGDGRYRALRDVLLREYPRVREVREGSALQDGDIDIADVKRMVTNLDESYLFIQGPPGSGKTWTGAQLIVHLVAEGKRVGVAATSHKAIHNLLHEVEKAAREQRVSFGGLKKAREGNADSYFESRHPVPLIENSDDANAFPPAGVPLVAGTAWLFARAAMDGALDHLIIDEAGQVSLADALAMGTTARNLVLLGDPQQLAQVSQGAHPEGAGVSVLGHLLGTYETIPPDRGIFLARTRRMHPDVCGFISALCYEGRLGCIDECAERRIEAAGPLTGTGIRYLPVEHEGNSQRSVEEAERIAEAIRGLEGARVVEGGRGRPLRHADIMVVAPYNAHVACLREKLPADVPVGTVDKFQGQEASVVFFSMATSSGADLPRRLEFLFSRNRLNVAVSRARCLAVLVASPRLLDVGCRTVEQMRMVNGLCGLVEVAG